ncbi:MAG: hypothetical protein AAF363_07660 [Bacteroidota bacterium]
MKLTQFKNLAIFCLLLLGCKQEVSDHPVFKYFPSEDVFREGYVSKYYYHFYPNDKGRDAATEISYIKYVKLDEVRYKTETYNAGFDLESERNFLLEGDSVILEYGSQTSLYTPADTNDYVIPAKTTATWDSEKQSPYQVQYTFGEQDYVYTEYQKSVYDTLIKDQPAKAFINTYDYKKVGQDSVLDGGNIKTLYVQGLGFFGAESQGDRYARQTELIEQMSIEEFEKRSKHGMHRVAWIDPENTISDDSDFKICGHERAIADYYNSDPDGRYIHTKQAMLDTIKAHLDESKLFDQSGRLVFRFVVNCEGKAGRFIAEGYDMSYQKMTFRQETIDHLFDIFQKLKEWRPTVIRGKARDAYFYITFNLENGKIVNILP